MSAVVWSQQIGDPRVIAWRFALVASDIGDQVVGDSLRRSWGLFELWVEGVNVCAHEEQGEQLTAAHWYLLPLAEWLAENWNPLFHEQRLPVPEIDGAASTAARAVTQLEATPNRAPAAWGFPASGSDDRLEEYQAWAARHRLTSSSPEGPLPEVWLRRTGSDLEISIGNTDTDLWDGNVAWSVPPLVFSVPVDTAADTTARALRGLLEELVRRGAPDGRVARARDRLDDATSWASLDEQLAWLVGLKGDTSALQGLRSALDELSPVEAVHTPPAPSVRPSPVLLSVPVATLFGALSPTVVPDDVHQLVHALISAGRPTRLVERLDQLAGEAPAEHYRNLTDGEAGGELGDVLARRMPQRSGQVEIAQYLRDDLGLTISAVELHDPDLRAVTLLHEDGRATIAVNTAYRRGSAPHVVRFTLAHELAHLVYDRAAAGQLAIASGPWTPARVERRANGFAAGLLMPMALLREQAGNDAGWPDEPSSLARTARRLGVGTTSLIERLHNVGMLTRQAADELVDELLP